MSQVGLGMVRVLRDWRSESGGTRDGASQMGLRWCESGGTRNGGILQYKSIESRQVGLGFVGVNKLGLGIVLGMEQSGRTIDVVRP